MKARSEINIQLNIWLDTSLGVCMFYIFMLVEAVDKFGGWMK